MTRKITAPIQVFGSGRSIAKQVGQLLAGCGWVGIPFCGGLSELSEIAAPTIVANDRHRHAINLYRSIKCPETCSELVAHLQNRIYHSDELSLSQLVCAREQPSSGIDVEAASDYFTCMWMARAGAGLTSDEFKAAFSFRWDQGSGGDSLVRWQNAIAGLPRWSEEFRRCHFLVGDGLEFIRQCKDVSKTGLYSDTPFPERGRKYLHNAGSTEAEERAWHTEHRNAVARFNSACVVCRFYDHPLIRELYPENLWTWYRLSGRDQHNQEKVECLLTNRRSVFDGGGV